MGFLNDKIIGRMKDPNYGLTALKNQISKEDKKKADDAGKPDETTQNNKKTVSDQLEERLRQIYATGNAGKPVIRYPKIVMSLDPLPAYIIRPPGVSGPSLEVDPSRSILRVHIFDSQATPHEDEAFLLSAINDSEVAMHLKTSQGGAASESAGSDAPIDPEDSSKSLETAINNGTIKTVAGGGSDYEVFVSNMPSSEIKRIIKTSMPSMTIGVGFTALTSFRMASTTGGPVGNVLLLQTLTDNSDRYGKPMSQTAELEDITVLPSQGSMSMLGCPLFEYGQQFFIDLGTGTTADNIYIVTGIQHSLSSGEFTTTATLSFNASGTIKTLRAMLKSAQPGLDKKVEQEKDPSNSIPK